MLYRVVAAVCGAAVMALEILGSRLLAPDFGSSIYVWGSLIGTFLAALSIGYWIGGVVADRWPSPRLLGCFVLSAAVGTVLLPRVASPTTSWVFKQVADERTGSLIACVLLFVLPSTFLGTVSPFLIRLAARSVGSMGSLAGQMYAISTIGSIAGTFLTAFYLIAILPVSKILMDIGAVLLLTGLALIVLGRHPKRAAPLAAAVLAGLALQASTGAHAQPMREIYRTDTLYHHIRVTELDGVRYLMFGHTQQSAMRVSDPLAGVFRYTDGFHLAFLAKPSIKRVLVIGLGGATGPKQIRAFYPGVSVDVAEIDPAVLQIARRYFALKTDSRLRVTVRDGRMFLRRTNTMYDAIMLDAYYQDGVPFHLTTQEFMRIVKEHLTPGGVVVANMIGSIAGSHSDIVRSQYKTMASVFGSGYWFPVLEAEESRLTSFDRRNIMLLFANGPLPSVAQMRARLRQVQRREIPALGILMEYVRTSPPQTSDVPLLTDDYAPVDNLLHVD